MAATVVRNEPAVLKYGRNMLEQYNLAVARKEFNSGIIIDQSDPTASNPAIMEYIRTLVPTELLDDPETQVAIVHKSIEKPGLSWHIDDCQITKRNKPPTYNTECYILLEDNKYLYFNTPNKKLPKYTLLFYSSTYNEDFTGGLLVLADNTTVKPRAGWGFMLDSREAHMVTPVLSGNRFVTVVKIY